MSTIGEVCRDLFALPLSMEADTFAVCNMNPFLDDDFFHANFAQTPSFKLERVPADSPALPECCTLSEEE